MLRGQDASWCTQSGYWICLCCSGDKFVRAVLTICFITSKFKPAEFHGKFFPCIRTFSQTAIVACHTKKCSCNLFTLFVIATCPPACSNPSCCCGIFNNYNVNFCCNLTMVFLINFTISRIVTYLLKIANRLLLPSGWRFLLTIRAEG